MHFALPIVVASLLSTVADAFYCHVCVSSSYRDCVWYPATSLTATCPEGDTQCATVILSDGHLFRGCSQSDECTDAGPGCVKCDEYSGCNTRRYPSDRLDCNICQVSASATCAQLPYAKQYEKPCVRHVAGDRCVTLFDQFNVALRGCLSSLTESQQSKCTEGSDECIVCDRANCNTAVVREDERCLQCTSNMTNCAVGSRPATKCNLPSGGQCFSRIDDSGYLHRGCFKDLTEEEKQSCGSGNRRCDVCTGTGCNQNAFPADALSCVQCQSTRSLSCVQQQLSDVNVDVCRRQIAGDRCYSLLLDDGTMQRGCSSDLPSACSDIANGTCVTCSGRDCNRAVHPGNRLSCYQCSSAQGNSCIAEQQSNNGNSLFCRVHRTGDQCYTKISQGTVLRGCLSDTTANACEGLASTECQLCYGSNCNHESEASMRNSAGYAFGVEVAFRLLTFVAILQHFLA